MKKTVFLCILALALVLCGTAMTAAADDFSWDIDADGTLLISGSRDMPDCSGTQAPWYESRQSIKTVIVTEGITSISEFAFEGCTGLEFVSLSEGMRIGAFAFSGCTSLTSVSIPYGVSEIADCAFSGCTALPSVVIPGSVETLGTEAFSGCTGLETVVLEDGMQLIGNSAFSGCSSLTSVSIPDSVDTIGDHAFDGGSPMIRCSQGSAADTYAAANGLRTEYTLGNTGLTWTLDEDGTLTVSGNGKITDYGDENQVPWAGARSEIRKVIIADGVTGIGSFSFFRCTALDSVSIPGSVQEIGDYAFRKCTSLTAVSIPGSVEVIGDEAFSYCTGLETLRLENGVSEIKSRGFYQCTSLTSVTIPGSVEQIQSYAFYNCAGLKSVMIENGVNTILEFAFGNCSSLTTVTIPESVVFILSDAFENCSPRILCRNYTRASYFAQEKGLPTAYQLSETGVYWNLTGDGTLSFFGNGNMPDYDNEDVWPWAADRSEIREVLIAEGITGIGSYAFTSCEALDSVSIPDSVICINSTAFEGCSPVILCSHGSAADIYAAANGLRTEYTLGNTGLTWALDEDGTLTVSGNGTITDYWDESQVPWAGARSEIRKVIIADGVTGIGSLSFFRCAALDSVSIPYSVQEIGDYAFWECTSLTAVSIPGNVKTIGSHAFEGCTGLETLSLENGVSEIKSSVFQQCASLTSVTIPGSVASIQDNAFYDCAGLKSVMIENGVNTIREFAFGNCSSLHTVTIPESVKMITPDAFENCSPRILCSSSSSTVVSFAQVHGLRYVCLDLCSQPYSDNSLDLIPGQFVNILVDVEGVTVRNDPYIYGRIMTDSYDMQLTDDGRVRVLAPCDTAMRVATLDGESVLIRVCAHEAAGRLTLPAGTKRVEQEAFLGTLAEVIVLPEGLESVGSRAFAESGAKLIHVPASVTEIAEDAFPLTATLVCEEGSAAAAWADAHGVNRTRGN